MRVSFQYRYAPYRTVQTPIKLRVLHLKPHTGTSSKLINKPSSYRANFDLVHFTFFFTALRLLCSADLNAEYPPKSDEKGDNDPPPDVRLGTRGRRGWHPVGGLIGNLVRRRHRRGFHAWRQWFLRVRILLRHGICLRIVLHWIS